MTCTWGLHQFRGNFLGGSRLHPVGLLDCPDGDALFSTRACAPEVLARDPVDNLVGDGCVAIQDRQSLSNLRPFASSRSSGTSRTHEWSNPLALETLQP